MREDDVDTGLANLAKWLSGEMVNVAGLDVAIVRHVSALTNA